MGIGPVVADKPLALALKTFLIGSPVTRAKEVLARLFKAEDLLGDYQFCGGGFRGDIFLGQRRKDDGDENVTYRHFLPHYGLGYQSRARISTPLSPPTIRLSSAMSAIVPLPLR